VAAGFVSLLILASVLMSLQTSLAVVIPAQIVVALLLAMAGVHVSALLHDAIPSAIRTMGNPTPRSAESVADGMAHFADHCAVCHGNDGSGDTEMGRGLYPKAPDMRLDTTQQLSDGDLFYIIEHGIRFTGMPGWRTGTTAGEESSWHLVHFIRHLPTLTPAELDSMKARNPRSPEDIRFEIEEERFLNEGAQK